jgi:ABC-type multidrug transport system permease subunit
MNVKRMLANLGVHLKQFTREKSTIFFVLLFPILLMVLFGAIFSDMGDSTYNLAIQDNDNGYWSQQLIEGLNETGVFMIIMVDSSDDPAAYMNTSGENTVLVIPAGFSEQINSTHTSYHYLGEAIKANSQAMNNSLMAIENSADAMAHNQASIENSTMAMNYMILVSNNMFPTYNMNMAIEHTENAIENTDLAMSSTGDSLTHTNQAIIEMGNALNFTIQAMTYEIQPDPALNLTVFYDHSVSIAQTKVQIIYSMTDGFNKGLSGARDVISIDVKSIQSEKFEFIDFFAPGIIAMSVMTTCLFGTVGMNTELRQKGILRKLATTPLTRSEWLLSNILYQLFMSMLSTTCILAIGMGIFGLRPHINIFMFVFIILCVFSFSGIGMLITRYVKEAQSAEAAANAVMFPMMFLSGTFFQLEMMPEFLRVIARALPLYYVNEGLRASMISLDMSVILECALIIGAFGIGVFVLGIYLTDWKED